MVKYLGAVAYVSGGRGLRRASQGRGAGVGRDLGVGVSLVGLAVGVGTGVPHGTTETCTVS